MPKYQLTQPLTAWPNDVPSLIAEMKRRAGVKTDRDLATFMGVAQSTVSHWRARGQVAESAVLRFEQLVAAQNDGSISSRAIAARMVAMRVADYWFSTVREGAHPTAREIIYGTVAGSFHSLTDQVYDHILKHEREAGLHSWEIASRMMEDEAFLQQIVDWLGTVSFADALRREAASPPTVRLKADMRFPNQVPQSSRGRKKDQ